MQRSLFTCLLIIFLNQCITENSQAQNSENLRVNQKRIENRLGELAAFGRDEEGRGYRIAYSDADIKGRAWMMDLMQKAGLEVRIDEAGNIIGTRKGLNPNLKPIAFGSHIDMVPDGGNYDGCLGVISGLEVIERLNEQNITTQHPLELIIFSNEEGGTIGSMAMAGHLPTEALPSVSQSGLSIAEGTKAIGGKPEEIKKAIRKKGDMSAFIELHIEQGGTLEAESIQIGVVEGIVGIVQWDVTIEGFANHAGTTPMPLRKDALLAASKMVVMVNETIKAHKGNQVGTVGRMQVIPGAYNVIPGKVLMGLEIRDLSFEKIISLFDEIKSKSVAIEESTGTSISFAKRAEIKPALTDSKIQNAIKNVISDLGLSQRLMPSGAGHDAQEMASLAPIGMIFIPSKDGISHSPLEYSSPEDINNGANVLLQTILRLDRELNK